MDFIPDLPKSDGYDTILVVIDRLTKMSHFIPCSKNFDARQFANLFMKEIVRLHGLPHDIITNRGTLFTSDLWMETTGEIRNRSETQHGFPPTNGWADRKDQCHIRTIPAGIHQLTTGRLVWLPTTSRICIQQRISRNHQEHTLLCKSRNQTRIRDDRSSDTRKANGNQKK